MAKPNIKVNNKNNRQQNNNAVNNKQVNDNNVNKQQEQVNNPEPETKVEATAPVNEVKQEEVKENNEPVVNKQPEKQPEQQQQQPVRHQPTSNINNVKSLEELFEVARVKGHGVIASRLERRINLFKRQHTEQEELAANYDLYNLIVEVLRTANRSQFNEKFDIINKAFLLGRNTYFKPTSLVRYDYLWQWGIKSKQQYELLVYAISKLANPGNRHIELKRIDLSKAVDGLPEVAKRNFVSYYSEGV